MSTEAERLLTGPNIDEIPGGMGTVRFIAKCPHNSKEVLMIARSTLQVAVDLSTSNTFNELHWASRLPKHFVQNCVPSPSQEDLNRELEQPLVERVKLEQSKRWSVRAFMNSFLPELNMRYWSWWDAVILDDDHIAIAVEVKEWPFPWQSLRWLLRGSGAIDLYPED